MDVAKTLSRRSFLAASAVAATAAFAGHESPARCEEVSGDSPDDGSATNSTYQRFGEYVLLPYTHYASAGVEDELRAVILFENKNSTFTRYQVAFTSCTCRDAASNYRSVLYAELLNNKDTADEAKLRQILFSQNEGYSVGLWGDSDPIHGKPDYTQVYMDENFVQHLVGLTMVDIENWGGYGTQPATVDMDAVTGATVSTANIMSVLRALCAYHRHSYYGE